MRQRLLRRLILLILLLASTAARAQSSPGREATERSSHAFSLPAAAARSTLALYNISGSVTVQGYAGSQVLVEATKTIRADDPAALALGLREAQPGFAQHGDSVLVYLAAPFDSRPHHQPAEQQPAPYRYAFDFVVKVPYQLQLHLSTINDGTVNVRDVTGPLAISNVNGGITLLNVQGTTQAQTVNGVIAATYAAAPAGASSYRTINGDIRVHYPASLGANATFTSLRGEFYTDFATANVLARPVAAAKDGPLAASPYLPRKETAVRFGAGGPDLRFETLTGNVTISHR